MANDNIQTLGLTIDYGTAGSPAATPLEGLRDLTEYPGLTFDEHEISEIDQEAITKQFALGLADGGHLGVVVGMEKAKFAALLAMADGVDRSWKITLRDGSTDTFEGPLKVLGVTAGSTNTSLVANVQVRVNTDRVFTPFSE